MDNGKWRMGNGKWRMGNGKWRMGNKKMGLSNSYPIFHSPLSIFLFLYDETMSSPPVFPAPIYGVERAACREMGYYEVRGICPAE